jgi:hypothetical protein
LWRSHRHRQMRSRRSRPWTCPGNARPARSTPVVAVQHPLGGVGRAAGDLSGIPARGVRTHVVDGRHVASVSGAPVVRHRGCAVFGVGDLQRQRAVAFECAPLPDERAGKRFRASARDDGQQRTAANDADARVPPEPPRYPPSNGGLCHRTSLCPPVENLCRAHFFRNCAGLRRPFLVSIQAGQAPLGRCEWARVERVNSHRGVRPRKYPLEVG